ncbi:response regulator [Blautia schinkii]|nr:response regulator [Blautia schinkii]
MDKIRVMLIDDDRLAVSYLESIVDWEALGYEIVGIAYNGKQALKLVHECSPQLVITDIIMPHMDGIELSQKVKEISKDIRVVLLTAYGEFEYARNAMQLGVDYYLMKDEINQDYLEEKLRFLKGLIQDNEKVSRILFQKAVIDYVQLGEQYVMDSYQDRALREFFSARHNYILIEQNFPIVLSDKWELKVEQRDFAMMLEKCLEVAGVDSERIRIHSILPESRILFVLERLGNGEYEESRKNRSIAERICKNINFGQEARYTVYVTGHPIKFSELYENLTAKESAFQAKKFAGTGRVYSITDSCMELGEFPKGLSVDVWKKYLKDDTLEDMLTEVYSQAYLKVGAASDLLYNFRQVYQALFQEEKKYSILLFDNDTMCGNLYDYQEAFHWLIQYSGHVKNLKAAGEKNSYRPEVERAMNYMWANYAQPSLKVSEIAQHLNISESRISVIFKEDTGKTLIQYLTAVRLDRAKNLLKNTDLKIYEIAEAVGYNNSQYLSNLFYKETGCFPLEYRHRNQEE